MRVMACEEGGYGDPALFISLPGPGLGYPSLRAQGSLSQQKRFFEPFVGDALKWAAFAVTEPGTGSDVAALTTTAIKRGDRYVINGKKWFIGNGARADWVVVFATVNAKQGQFGVRAFVVERGTPGFRVARVLPTMGMKPVQLTELVFEDCEISEENLLGGQKQDRRGGGFQASVHTFNLVRPGIAAVAVGIGRAAVEQVSDLVKQDGARHSSAHRWREIEERIKAMNRKLEAARLLCWNAASIADQGADNTREASMAKAYGAKVGMEVCVESMELAARAGIQDMSMLERLFRNIKVFNILEGTGEIQRLTITKSLLRRQNGAARN
jgi:acyl-CoA dehydrogenase